MTHRSDAEIRKDLYKVNKLTEIEMTENLIVLLEDDNPVEQAIVFPNEDELFEKLQSIVTTQQAPPPADEQIFMTNEPLAVIWDEVEGRKWYIGFYLDENEDGTFRIDHLKKAKENRIEAWERPSGPDDIQCTMGLQILPIKVLGEWNFSGRKPSYILENAEEIQNLFLETP